MLACHEVHVIIMLCKLGFRAPAKLLMCFSFAQKLLEVQTVVGSLLGGGWGVGVMAPVGVSWLVAHGTSQPSEKSSCEAQRTLEPIRRAERGGGGLRALARSITTRPEEGL